MPLQATSGAASYDGFGGGVPFVPTYIEDVFSTYLYTGNSTSGGTQTITNNIDLSTKGGMVWIKGRSAASNHILTDTTRGAGTSATNNNALASNLADAEDLGGSSYDYLSSFSTTGFVVTQGGTTAATRGTNYNSVTYASWTFRKQPKFFDVVTYTGDGTQGRAIPHSLGAVPGAIICRKIAEAQDWHVYHRSLGANGGLYLNGTSAFQSSAIFWNNTSPTSTAFYVGNASGDNLNQSGKTYVAYLFAHDAGGFGLSGSDNVISCGSFTTNGSGVASVSLGYEPQLILWKRTDSTSDWYILDTMRGLTADPANSVAGLRPNLSNAETTALTGWSINATGFGWSAGAASATYIYIAIRRGPMKTPTSGTSVYAANFGSDVTTYTTNFPLDMGWDGYTLGGATDFMAVGARLLDRASLATASTAAESTAIIPSGFWQSNTSYRFNAYGNDCATYAFRRAPGFFDVVCYTGGTGTPRVLNHNLAVAPELLITRIRNFSGEDWVVHYNNGSSIIGGYLNSTSAFANSSTAPSTDVTSFTATTYTLNTSNRRVNGAYNYVAYLFASCPGVSKVGSYTGTGTTLQVNCGFTAGARFVLIKRTDSTGDWYLWDSARGIVAGNDPYLRLNTNAAEVTNTDYVDTYSAGFEISSTAPAAINANGGSFVFLAIA